MNQNPIKAKSDINCVFVVNELKHKMMVNGGLDLVNISSATCPMFSGTAALQHDGDTVCRHAATLLTAALQCCIAGVWKYVDGSFVCCI